jgi:D-beta-D-heptose 7-phosphate kinase/D-beta-D-heptose 1-phosphate adenosyltransferase
MALITLDRDGMILVTRDGAGEAFPTNARAVYDITGAGDMVLATMGVCLGAGVSPQDSVRLSNVAAGIEVERSGVAIVHKHEIRAELLSGRQPGARKILTLDQAREIAEQYRRQGQSIVFTNGCFDLLHVGHVVIFGDDTPHALLHAIRPDVLVKGGTYTTDEVVGHEIVEAYGGQVRVTGVVDGVSTSRILESLGSNTLGGRIRLDAPHETSQPASGAVLRRAG